MTVPILIVTPSVGFGELIRQTLEEAGGYQVMLVNSGNEALDHAQKRPYALAILDADVVDIRLLPLWRGLKKQIPDLLLIVIPPDEGLPAGEVAELSPQGYLNKPFYLPSLTATVNEVLGDIPVPPPTPAAAGRVSPAVEKKNEEPVEESSSQAPPPWLQDVDRAAQYLTRLTLESSAQAALITRGEKMWAYAGELPQPAAHELARAIADYWANDGGTDLARFVRLEATGSEYMLYATALVGDMVLSLAFDAATPFSKIRNQAGQLARALATEPNDKSPTEPAPQAADPTPTSTEPDLNVLAATDGWVPEDSLDPPPPPLLDDVPLPGPLDWRPDENHTLENPKPEPDPPKNQRTGISLDLSQTATASPEIAVSRGQEQPDPPAGPLPSFLDFPLPELNQVVWERESLSSLKAESPMPVMPEFLQSTNIESAAPVMHHLSYACVLVPRIPEHHLTGDLAARLTEWVPQYCLAFGWRLNHLAIRPDHLQWVARAAPEESPASLVDVMRQVTSLRIFEDFPKLANENPSGDFWAPGYLLVGDTQPLTGQIIKAFIDKTRAWQGASGRE